MISLFPNDNEIPAGVDLIEVYLAAKAIGDLPMYEADERRLAAELELIVAIDPSKFPGANRRYAADRPSFASLSAANATLTARVKGLEEAIRKSLGFVSHAADIEDWCGCDDCRKEWTDLVNAFHAALAALPGAGEGTGKCTHDRLNEDGQCRRCGADRRGI